MKKDVIISIRGLQFVQDGDETEPVEVVTCGEYYKKDQTHYLLYDEMTEGFKEVTRNVIKFKDKSLEVKKKGTDQRTDGF